MFERFRSAYESTRDAGTGGTAWRIDGLVAARGYAEFAAEFAGASFSGGLYRVHDQRSGPLALKLVRDAFPEFAQRVVPFGYDWLGRQFTVDSGRRGDDAEPLTLLLEPGTGEALEIPVTFAGFHDEELVEYADPALAGEFFKAWASSNSESLPLAREACVGYRVPLFLGGADTLENLEISDLDVYWSVCGQLRQGARDLPPGTTIGDVSGR